MLISKLSMENKAKFLKGFFSFYLSCVIGLISLIFIAKGIKNHFVEYTFGLQGNEKMGLRGFK
jgi:hypothetical protein